MKCSFIDCPDPTVKEGLCLVHRILYLQWEQSQPQKKPKKKRGSKPLQSERDKFILQQIEAIKSGELGWHTYVQERGGKEAIEL
jgi:hypothetical protein